MLVAVIGCSEEDGFDYAGGAQVYFERVAGSGTADSTTYSFAVRDNDLQSDVIEIPLVVTGKSVDYNREVNLVVDTTWLDYKVKINDILTKPARWIYECQPYFGTYSKVKYRYIIDVLGIWDFPDSGENAIPKGQMLFYKDKMKSELARWEKENNKQMLDENNVHVDFDR